MRELQTVVVEPNVVVRTAIQMVLVDAGYSIFASLDSSRQLVTLQDCPPNLTVVVIGGRGASSIGEIASIRAAIPRAAIVVLGGRLDTSSMLETIRSGANVCLDDATTCETFYKSLELATADLAVMSVARETAEVEIEAKAAAGHILEVPEPDEPPDQDLDLAGTGEASDRKLSPREALILSLLQEGASNKLIARQLRLAEATVKVHLKSILRKIRVKNRTQAAVWACARDAVDREMCKAKNGAYDVSVD